MFENNWKQEIFSIPNMLSFFRLALIPVYIITYIHAVEWHDYVVSGGILAVSCLTDMVDGKIARKYNMITTLGKILDPIADKATQFALTVCLSIEYPVLRLVLILFVAKEMFQGIVGLLFLRKGMMLPGAILAGKICTTVLFVSLILMVLFPDLPEKVISMIALIDSIFLVFSLVSYIFAYFGRNQKLEELDA